MAVVVASVIQYQDATDGHNQMCLDRLGLGWVEQVEVVVEDLVEDSDGMVAVVVGMRTGQLGMVIDTSVVAVVVDDGDEVVAADRKMADKLVQPVVADRMAGLHRHKAAYFRPVVVHHTVAYDVMVLQRKAASRPWSMQLLQHTVAMFGSSMRRMHMAARSYPISTSARRVMTKVPTSSRPSRLVSYPMVA